MTHDPLCPFQPEQIGFGGMGSVAPSTSPYIPGVFCQCALIAHVRDDERQQLASINSIRLSKKATDTQKKAATLTLPRTGTRLNEIYNHIIESNGLTDFQIEEITGLAHQSASAARNTLMQRGLVTDSGQRRKNRRGHDAIVWIAVPRDRSSNDRSSPANSSPDDRTTLFN